ncbi:MAG TPA: hypothetical protein PLL06_16560, partial [Acidobacteriota bacterium]|nr:hypothetical protein [Acidobacteriota bacterium]
MTYILNLFGRGLLGKTVHNSTISQQALNDLPHFSHGDAVRTDKMMLIEPKSKDKKDTKDEKDTQDKAEVGLV